MGSVSMVYFDLRQSFNIISPLFSGYTISLPGRVFGEQRGGAAEILSRIGVELGERTQSTDPAAARSPPSRDVG